MVGLDSWGSRFHQRHDNMKNPNKNILSLGCKCEWTSQGVSITGVFCSEEIFFSIVLKVLSLTNFFVILIGSFISILFFFGSFIFTLLFLFEHESCVISLCSNSDLRPDNFNPLDLHCSLRTLTVNFWKGVISLLFIKKLKWLFVWVLCTYLCRFTL